MTKNSWIWQISFGYITSSIFLQNSFVTVSKIFSYNLQETVAISLSKLGLFDSSISYNLYFHLICNLYFSSKSKRLAKYLEKAMAPHSSTLAWKIPRMEEPGRLQSMGSLRVGHD